MVDKLARFAFMRSPDLPPGEIGRDEVRKVIVDTSILCAAEAPGEMLKTWVEGK